MWSCHNRMNTYNVLDLFCGCGGMSWGLHKKGFNIVGGIDIWDVALKTFKLNEPQSMTLKQDISLMEPQEALQKLGLTNTKIDVIIGGPPCQGFSKNTPASWRFLEDPRNQLYRSYLHYVEYIKPTVVIIENVPEIYSAYNGIVRKEIVNTLENWGYHVSVKIINMSDYGIPQKRKRCFFFASKNTKPQFPVEHKRIISAWDAISDLPVVKQGEGTDGMEYTSEPVNNYQKHMRDGSLSVYNHNGHVLNELQTKRISSLKPGQGLKDLPEELKVKGGYSGAYGRLDYVSVSPTITRWCFHIGSGRFSHPREIRSITMREAARIQSFSDDFHFVGSFQEQAGQIGNAVPPLFMEQLSEKIIDTLEGVGSKPEQLDLFSI